MDELLRQSYDVPEYTPQEKFERFLGCVLKALNTSSKVPDYPLKSEGELLGLFDCNTPTSVPGLMGYDLEGKNLPKIRMRTGGPVDPGVKERISVEPIETVVKLKDSNMQRIQAMIEKATENAAKKAVKSQADRQKSEDTMTAKIPIAQINLNRWDLVTRALLLLQSESGEPLDAKNISVEQKDNALVFTYTKKQ